MGIFDIFRGKGKEDRTNDNNEEVSRGLEQDLILNYKSGDQARVVFKDMEEVDGKLLQKAIAWYGRHDKEDAVMVGKELLLEPHIGKDRSGKEVYDTEAYYKYLAQNDKMGAVKGFFQKEQVNVRETNYIGILEFDSQDRAIRGEDGAFLQKYRETYKMRQEEKRRSKQESENNWKKQMEDQVNKIPEGIDNPSDHATILTPDMFKDWEEEEREEKAIGKGFDEFVSKKKKEEQYGYGRE